MFPFLNMVVAASSNGVIGCGDALPWRQKADLQRFRQLTLGNTVVMGRRTYESIGRILPDRHSIILSGDPYFSVPGALVFHSWNSVIGYTYPDRKVFVIGGQSVYEQALPYVRTIHFTHIMAEIEGDTFMPDIENFEYLYGTPYYSADDNNEYPYSYMVLRNKNENIRVRQS